MRFKITRRFIDGDHDIFIIDAEEDFDVFHHSVNPTVMSITIECVD